jgi:pimeloyl-ACP methyl ester carboxylesterase
MRPFGVQLFRRLPTPAQLRLAMRVLPHVPAASVAWLRALGWAGRRRVFGRIERHELRIARPDAGCVRGVLHPVRGSRAAVLAVGGSTGGLHGPAWIYPELCARLQSAGIAGLRLDYARPNRLEDCTQDVLAGIHFLEEQGSQRVVLLGWSFGGAVVIRAGVQSTRVVAVATVGAQTAGTGAVGRLAPRPLLVLHGTADPILPDRCARDLYARAAEPKELGLYPGDGHGLEHHQTAVLDRLVAWTQGVLRATTTPEGGAERDPVTRDDPFQLVSGVGDTPAGTS